MKFSWLFKIFFSLITLCFLSPSYSVTFDAEEKRLKMTIYLPDPYAILPRRHLSGDAPADRVPLIKKSCKELVSHIFSKCDALRDENKEIIERFIKDVVALYYDYDTYTFQVHNLTYFNDIIPTIM